MKERTPRYVLVYDGECSFCRMQIERIRRMDARGSFEYVASQTPGLIQRFPALASSDFNTGMRLITPDARIFIGADALARIARQLPGWSWVAWLYDVPGLRTVARMAYKWVAAHRTSLGPRCESGTCDV